MGTHYVAQTTLELEAVATTRWHSLKEGQLSLFWRNLAIPARVDMCGLARVSLSSQLRGVMPVDVAELLTRMGQISDAPHSSQVLCMSLAQ